MNIVLLEPLLVPQETINTLAAPLKAAGHRFKAYDTPTKDPGQLIQRAQGADIIIIDNTPLPAQVIQALPQLKFVDVAFTGVDQVALDACRARGILLSNCAGYSDTSVAELVCGLPVALWRQIPACQQATRSGGTSQGLLGTEIAGKTVGILGTGHIGTRVAQLFLAFGARVLGYARHQNPHCVALGVEYPGLKDLLTHSDILTVHLPLTPETRGFLDAEKIAAMKPGSYLVNCARGPIVDTPALAQALTSGHLAGAAIDVFEQEPPLPSTNPLLKAPHTVLTPHVGYFTAEAMVRRATIAFENVAAYCQGAPQNLVI